MASTAHSVRPPAVAGAFYPEEPAALLVHLDDLLVGAAPHFLRPKALIVPHAGTIFSGPIAATAYRVVAAMDPSPTRVVVLGPAHRVYLDGLALPGVEEFETPLGRIPLDPAGVAAVEGFPFVTTSRAAHAQEHSIEVQLPFLQRTLGRFTLVPLVVGRARPAEVAAVLDALWGGPETLLVVSSDLSHFLPHAEAQRLDAHTVKKVLALNTALTSEEACGAHPVAGLLELARRRGLTAHLLDARNSGDTAGDLGRVVGYGAFAFTESAS